MAKILKTEKDFSSGGIVWDRKKNRLLLVQVRNLAKKTVWTFPKGHPEDDETDKEAAVREVLEETGWKCEIKKPLTQVYYTYIHHKTLYQKTVRWFLMAPQRKMGRFDPKEIRACQWFSPAAAAKKVVYDSDKTLLKKL